MKFKTMYCLLSAMFFLLFSCDNNNEDDNEDTLTTAQGTIRLSGNETQVLGTSLTVGNLEVGNVALSGTN